MPSPQRRALAALAGACLAGLLAGCAQLPELPRALAGVGPEPAGEPVTWFFFERPDPRDPWRLTIGGWQVRERTARNAGQIAPFPTRPGARPPVASRPGPTPTAAAAPEASADEDALVHRYDAFLVERRRRLARDVLGWIQDLSRDRFVEDGPLDRWPTLAEVLSSRGDDCDGLELVAYHALRQLGFPEGRVYRAVVHQPSTGRHHMVTFWFEDPSDPWVLDPTATITTRLRRLSELRDWVPVKLFTERQEFTVTAR